MRIVEDGSLVYEPRRFRLGEAWSAFVLCATPGVIVSLAIGSPGGYATAILAAAAGVWSIHRAFRIRLAVDEDGVIVDNYWRTHQISWPEIAGVGIAVKGILPQPALGFSLRTGGAVFAKATPLRQTERQTLRAAVLTLAPPSVETLPDVAARFGIGSDRALSNRFRLWWVRDRTPDEPSARALVLSAGLAFSCLPLGIAVLVGAIEDKAGALRYLVASLLLVAGVVGGVGFALMIKKLVFARRANSAAP